MYCKKCGAVVVGKYCSCCGNRILTPMEESAQLRRRIKRDFMARHDNGLRRLAEACWTAAEMKYAKYGIPFADEDDLNKCADAAEYLFQTLKNF